MEADRREKDADRKYTVLINDKSNEIYKLTNELELYKNKVLDMERKNKD